MYKKAHFKYFTNTTAKSATQNTTISVALGANFNSTLQCGNIRELL